jgi:GTP diphosphokinase / guanosine-3',5'-bis(diphosphate) 3'-diphosphatase
MIRIEDIVEKVEKYQKNPETDLIRQAYVFSAMVHKEQLRQSGEPYLIHPLEVASILCDMKLDTTSIAVGLLHDVVEDSATSVEQIEKFFGKEIAHVVDGVTKISKASFRSKEEQQAESFRKMILAMVDDLRVILVKLADRLHNMRTLQYLPPEKRIGIARETMEIYAPIAHRLGMAKIRGELQDLALQHLDPESYSNVEARVEIKKKQVETFIEETQNILKKKVRENGFTADIHYRIKGIYSIHDKMRRQRIDMDKVYDFVAFRIITENIKSCYGILGIIHQLWRPIPGRFKDFISLPKPNLYQSLHTSVVSEKGFQFEVQIRTEEMHRIAEEGIAAHWKYKEGKVIGGKDEEALRWLRHLVEWHREVSDNRDFMNAVRVELYPEEVYAFTPKGDIKEFPRGATPLDFAYSIHTDIGHQCIGARVNGKLVTLRYKLKNGDIVEILTQPNHNPSRDWLAIVQTSRARNKIKQWLNANERVKAIELGKKLLEKQIRKHKLNVKKVLKEDQLNTLLPEYGCAKLEDLYSSLGYGKLSAKQVVDRLVPQAITTDGAAVAPPVEEPEEESKLTAALKRALRIGTDETVKVHGAHDLLVYLAKCCNPIRGEPIIGYITRGKGISVHSSKCPNLERLLFNPERRIEVEWSGKAETPQQVKVSIWTEDKPGMLAEISTAIVNSKTNIRTVQAQTFPDKHGQIELILEIVDTKHLDRVLSSIRSLEGVLEVERILH